MSKANTQDIFENYSVPKSLLSMIIPTVFSQLIVLIYNLADTFFVGRTGDPYMVAAASLLLPIFNVCIPFGNLTGIGGGALISRLLGEHKEEEAKKVSAFSIWFAVSLACLYSLAMLIFMKPILLLLGASENTLLYATQYATCIIVLGAVPTIASNVMANLVRSNGFSKEAGFGITMGGLINIGLDPLFMFVLLPKGNEILGAGIATLISNCIACAYFVIVILKMKNNSVLRFTFKKGLPGKKHIGAIFAVGIPSAVASLLFDLDYIIIDKLMAAYGDVALAGIGIVLKAERLPLNVGVGICQGMLPLVAYNYSARNKKRMTAIIKLALIIGLCVGAFSIIMYESLAPYIMEIFISESQTVSLGTVFLRARSFATPFMFMSFFAVYIFQGFGQGKVALCLAIIRWAILNIPFLFILNSIFGMYGIVWSQLTGDFTNVVISLIIVLVYVKKHKEDFTEKGLSN